MNDDQPTDGRLHAGRAASYRWGDLLLEVSAAATAEGRTVMEAMAATAAGSFPWKTGATARGAIAVLHETIHLQQDLATGIGAWDHLTTRHAFARLTTQTRWLVTKLDAPPYRDVVQSALRAMGDTPFTTQVKDDITAIEDRTVAWRQLRVPHGRRRRR